MIVAFTIIISIKVKFQNSYKATSELEEHKALKTIKHNSKYFFSYDKRFSKIKNKIVRLVEERKMINDQKQMAEILSKQYSSVFSKPSQPSSNTNFEAPLICDIPFDEKDFEEMIDELHQTSAAGPDAFPAIFLTNFKKTLENA